VFRIFKKLFTNNKFYDIITTRKEAEKMKDNIKSVCSYAIVFLKWVLIAVITGTVGGFIGTLFHIAVEKATEIRMENPYIIYYLPLGGLAIVLLYKACKASHKLGTNNVIRSARAEEHLPWVLAPLIFISTAITHLFGGSAGREGAALQLGGSIGTVVGRMFRLDEKDLSLVVTCGMSAVFSALFGTPITATFFVLEVVNVGIMQYSGLAPSLFASLTAFGISVMLGAEPVWFGLQFIPRLNLVNIVKTVGVGAVCAVISIVFCVIMEGVHKLYSKHIKNLYARAFVGGVVVVLLTVLVGTYDYNGAGMDIVADALSGNANPEAFILKIIFTALTIGAGFKGGEIVPTFFIGSTLGCVLGGFFGLDAGFCAALGLIGLFCGVVNSPVASLILSIELFGTQGFVFFAVVVAVSYVLSGYFGLYSSQKIVYSKLKTEEHIN